MSFKNYLQESVNDKGTFKCLFITSSPLAGKSYTLSKIKGGTFPVSVVNTDIATEFLADKYDIPEHEVYNYWGDSGKKVKTMTRQKMFHTLNGVLPMAVDSTSSNEKNLFRRKGIVESLGYDTAMVYIDIPLETALERLRKVKAGEDPNRTRSVDEDFLIKAWKDTKSLAPTYERSFNHFQTLKVTNGEINDRTLLQAYNKTQKFFGEPKNGIAEMNIEKMREAGEVYLIPSVMSERELKSQVEGWYRKN